MPIRFRCRHCNQLMGISRRKAGMTVQCPTCHASVVVPQPDAEEPPEPRPPQPLGDAPAPLFERSDFEAFLQNPAADKPAPPPVPPPPPPTSPFATDFPPSPPSPFATDFPPSPSVSMPSEASGRLRGHPPGLLLSPTQATWLTVVVILLVALAFGAGLLVGHYWIG
jgi:phage FluMu protein Com